MINKFQNVISKIILICVAIFTSVVFIQMWFNLFRNYFPFRPERYVLVLCVGLILFILAGYILYHIRDDSRGLNNLILGILLVIFAIFAIFWIKVVPDAQVSDFGYFWQTSAEALKGKAIYSMDNDYFAKWAYQSGFLVYVMAVVKIFGQKVIALQLLNVVYQVLILLVTYKLIVKIFHSVKMARMGVLLLMVNLDWFALNSQADNQYLGSLLFLTTFYLILQDKYWTSILAGITLALGAIIRPIGPVVIAGIVVFAILYWMLDNNKFNWDAVFKLVIILGLYFVVFSGSAALIKGSGLNAYGLSNRDSEWKFVIGLDSKSNGVYDQALVETFDQTATRAKMSKREHKVIRQNIKQLNHSNGWFSLLQNKLSILWAERTNAIDFTGFDQNHSASNTDFIRYVGYVGSVITIIFAFIGTFRLFKVDYSSGIFLLLLPLMAFVIVQLLIEVQGRYRIEFIPILAILGANGVRTVFNWLNAKWRDTNGKRV